MSKPLAHTGRNMKIELNNEELVLVQNALHSQQKTFEEMKTRPQAYKPSDMERQKRLQCQWAQAEALLSKLRSMGEYYHGRNPYFSPV